MIKAWTDEAWEEFEYWLHTDKRITKRILQLLKDSDRKRYTGIGKPERLTGTYRYIGVDALMIRIALYTELIMTSSK